MDDRDKLLREQQDAQKERDKAVSELKEIQGRGERLPQELKDRAREANDKIVSLGTRIADLDKEHERQEAEDAEFFNGLNARVSDVTDALETRDERDIEDPTRRDVQISRETVSMFEEVMRDVLGSRMDRGPVRRSIPESEALMNDIIMCHPSERDVRAGEFDRRRNEIAKRHNRWYGDPSHQPQARVNVIGADTATATGGILVPDDNMFMSQVQLAASAYGGVKKVARTFVTSDGRPLPIPVSYNQLTQGAKVNENVDVGDFDMVFGEENMHSYMATSGRLGMTFQLMRDAGPNMSMLLGLVAGQRIERQEAHWFINGTGATGLVNGQPQGLNAAYTVAGYTFYWDNGEQAFVNAAGADGSMAANLFGNNWVKAFRDIKYAVNPAYRASNNFSFVIGDHLDGSFAGAVDADGNLLRGFERWLFGNTAKGMGINLGGMNILSDYSIAAPGDSDTTQGWVGDFNWFWIRRVRGMYMLRNPYTKNLTTTWIFARACDSQGLFTTEDSAALSASNIDGGGFAAIKAIPYDSHA